MEAVSLPERTADFAAAHADIPFSYMIVLTQDQGGGLPDPIVAENYAEAVGNPDFPVLADPLAASIAATPWDGNTLPGKCVLTPEQVILDCFTGDDDAPAFELIAADWAAR